MSGNTKIRGRQIETDDFIKSVRNADVDWTNDANTASQKAIAQLVGDSTEKFYGSAVGTAAVTTSGHRTSAIWDITDESVESLYDGMPITVRVPVAGNASYGTVIRFNGGDMHPVVFNVNSGISTRYGVGAFVVAHYDATQTATYYNNSNTAKTATGVWKVMDYDVNTTPSESTFRVQSTFLNYNLSKVGTYGIHEFSIIMEDSEGHLQSLTTTGGASTTKKCNPSAFVLGNMWYANGSTTLPAGTVPSGYYLYDAFAVDFSYSSNCGTGLTTGKFMYLVGSIGEDGYYYLDDIWWTQDLPSSDDGKVYIYVGNTYGANHVLLARSHPAYVYKDGGVRLYSGWADLPKQIQADWSEEDETSPAHILHKPVLVNDKNFVYEWSTPLSTITISHNLDKFPAVTIVDTAGNDIVGDVAYIDINTVTITFSAPTRGTAYFN